MVGLYFVPIENLHQGTLKIYIYICNVLVLTHTCLMNDKKTKHSHKFDTTIINFYIQNFTGVKKSSIPV